MTSRLALASLAPFPAIFELHSAVFFVSDGGVSVHVLAWHPHTSAPQRIVLSAPSCDGLAARRFVSNCKSCFKLALMLRKSTPKDAE